MATKQPSTDNRVGHAQPHSGYSSTHNNGYGGGAAPQSTQRLYTSNVNYATTPKAQGNMTNNAHPSAYRNPYPGAQYPTYDEQDLTAEQWKNLKSRIEDWRLTIPGRRNHAKGPQTDDNGGIPEKLDAAEAERYKRWLAEKDKVSEFSYLRYGPQVVEGNSTQTISRAGGQRNDQRLRDDKGKHDESLISSDDDWDESV